MDDGLKKLLIAAGEAPPDRRIEYRDQIASYGALAIVEMADWAKDPNYVAFAIRVIGKAAERGALADGVAALRRIATDSVFVTSSGDAKSELARLGATPARAATKRPSIRAKPTPGPSMDPGELVIGREYKRGPDLHDRGLGGNRQKGISYPADGDYVLLFSDPDSRRDYGYKDTWRGLNDYRYFGEWNGTMQMELNGGNHALIDRSPNIHLFVKSPKGHRYEGRFAYSSHEYEWTERDGRAQQALVFSLRRAPAS